MTKTYVLVADGAAATAIAGLSKPSGTIFKVHVRNVDDPKDLLTVDSWWASGADGVEFNYMTDCPARW